MWRLLLLVAAAAASDLDFEFADTAQEAGHRGGHYIVEPDALALCGGRRCGAALRCAVRRGRAVCVPPRPHRDRDRPQPLAGGCVSCPAAAAGEALCGSDNRTYASLCRLDLRNCERRRGGGAAVRPAAVRPACRRACPCGARSACEAPQLAALAARLLDWFSVVRRAPPSPSPAAPPPAAQFPAGCLPEVRWMFAHLDADDDGTLSARDLHALMHDDREQCLRPFLSRCADGAGGAAGAAGAGGAAGAVGAVGAITRSGWCGCMRGAARPCARLSAAHPPLPGAYVPSCDAQGYFQPRQCAHARTHAHAHTHTHAHAARTQARRCWCVDRVGSPRDCRKHEEAEGAPADDEDTLPGSGDGEPAY